MIVGLDVAVYGVQPVSNENAYGVLGK
jgi:hypothetical protein